MNDREEIYLTLGVAPNASHEEIVDAYMKELARYEKNSKLRRKYPIYNEASTQYREHNRNNEDLCGYRDNQNAQRSEKKGAESQAPITKQSTGVTSDSPRTTIHTNLQNKEAPLDLLILGDSNTRAIQPDILYPDKHVRKELTFNLPQASAFIEGTTIPDPKVIDFHVGTNDARDWKDSTAVSEGFRQLITSSHNKFPHTPLVLSSVLPRDSRNLQAVGDSVNSLLQVIAEETSYVHLADNNNLSEKGTINKSLYNSDGYHLNRYGIRVLASNIKKAVNPLLDLGRYTSRRARSENPTPADAPKKGTPDDKPPAQRNSRPDSQQHGRIQEIHQHSIAILHPSTAPRPTTAQLLTATLHPTADLLPTAYQLRSDPSPHQCFLKDRGDLRPWDPEEDIVTSHYEDLARTIDSIPAHHLLLVVGDFNARIGSEDAKFPFHEETNRNGRQLLDLASEKDLFISSTYFRKKAGKLWTFISPGGTKYQLDHVLIRRKWRNSMLNVEAYNSFASVGSDHRIVSARARLSLRKKKAEPRKKQYDWELFRSRRDIQEQYTVDKK
ncbi:Hypp7272 [Branchiostoma lanceolatum]|uniref:Hypp7272 protein n=1 Tax=Branchiostoma lanceolatum TaxID=7740 RepID=A0A8J9YYZ9_BRALA|nr:Hypp7272 [Branchiostoma lanceolatum]